MDQRRSVKMNSIKLCASDLHLHTNLSYCAPSTTKLASYLPHCANEGIAKIGIANHLYANNGVEHILQIQQEIRVSRENSPIEILLGCEAELFYGQEPMLSKKDAACFDYVLLAPSHIFNQMHEYKTFDLSTSEKIRKLIIDNFKCACYQELGVPTAICHPLYPICAPNQQEIIDGITDKELTECYTLAAEKNKSIEVHACVYRNSVPLDGEGLSPSYIRMLSIAKECGCKFHFGSDAHSPESFVGTHSLLERAAERAGICKDDLWEPARL